MSRRLLTAGLLLTALAWCGRSAAKPPDLPLVDKDVLAPPSPLASIETVGPSQPNPFPQAAEPAAPALDTPLLFQLRPAARRIMGACLLFGVHPMLTLTPTADYLDFDDDDAPIPVLYLEPSVSCPNRRVIELLNQSEDLRQIADQWERFWLIDHPSPRSCDQADGSLPAAALNSAGPNDSTESVCPGMRQLHCAARQDAAADFDHCPDVLHNLELLQQAQTLLQTAEEFGRSGRIGEALGCLELAHGLCPGSRIDEAVQETAASLFAPIYCGSASYDFGPEEQSKPPATKTSKEHEIEMKLTQPVTLNFSDAPLREVIDDLRAQQNVNVYVNEGALDADEISLNHPVTIKIENISLKTALKLILRQVHLTYIIEDDVVQITTERCARGKMMRVVYAVADLLEGGLHCPGAPVESDAKSPEEALRKLITRTISPQEWREMGGPGFMDFHPLTRSLVVNATADVQEQVADLLNALRRLNGSEEEEERQGEGSCEGCKKLLKACHEAMDAGRHCEAAALAARAYALDPKQAAADPLVYKMHLVGDDAEPVEITPCLPPVDPDTPAALDQLYEESLRSAPAGGEEQEPPVVTPPSSFEFGVGLDGSVQMFGQLRHGGAIWHLFFDHGGLAVWSSPDGGATPMPIEKTPDGIWDY